VPVVLVDRIELQQILVNLIRNALEALTAFPMADRRLTIETHGGRIEARPQTGGGTIFFLELPAAPAGQAP
jgi:signal transduction histidine kinase